MRKNVIEVQHLSKSYKDLKAVDDISFVVKEGELFAFLGLNGAGKSTTINMMTGTLARDKGQILIDGLDIDKHLLQIKSLFGVVFQTSCLDSSLSCLDNLRIRGHFYGLRGKELSERINFLTEKLNFKAFLKRPLKKLSGGQRRKIDIARALINKPRILVLDEPTTGLDPKTRQEVWQALNDLRRDDNVTIFLTTHYMEETANADYVVLIDEGRIVANDTPDHLKEKYTGDYLKLYKEGLDSEKLLAMVAAKELKLREEKDFFLVEVKDPQEAADVIADNRELFGNFEFYKGNMDDVFLNATGKKIKEVI